ncbi:coiled-coil domain-containing protein 66 isoform X2 [Myripristis murdjan]|uniref:coiled-coil domain-containing protein 66 isoform X2 n=1 Tax=Myripristis murdjan TaxID=586833 RepID=UPI001175CBF3|nr:coiled-coil domain-containing protein 66 isoform X2 [Myripristis murdjan]
MNLGDGLLFEVENGKAKLSVLSRGTEKNPAKVSCRPRAANILSSRQVSCVKEAQREEQPARRQAGRHREARRSRAEGAAAASSTSNTAAGGRSSTLTSSITSKTRTNHTAECSVKAAPKVKLDRRKHSSTIQSSRATGKAGQLQNTVTLVSGKDTLANGEAGLKENVVCLTSEQLQQILDTIQPSDSRQHPTEDQSTQGNETDSKTSSSVNKTEGDEGGDATGPAEPTQDKDRPRGSLLSWLEDQQSTRRAALDARRAQWRRELDEQVALKQQQSWAPGKRQAEVDTDSVLSVQSCSSHTEQPAAIGSNFRYGEALSQERREEQRRLWLEELDRQREEATQRRRQEKLLQRETDDFYHWAMHFDSLQKRPLVQAAAPPCLPPAPPALPAALHPAPPCLPPAPPALPAALHPAPPALPAALHPAPPSLPPAPPALPAALHPAPPSLPPAQAPAVGQDRGEWEAAPSSSLSLGWEVLSSCGAESAGRASVGTTSGYPARASHLRTMTALLDPTQIEERERRRLKQLEHQRALAAQAEERRLQREEEEARRREQEQEDERRVALEREKLQRQYQLEVQRERQRKDRLVHPSDDVSPSVQSAEQEEQKLTRLTSNSHNVGNLQETQRPSEVNRPGQCLGGGGAGGEEQDDLDEVRSSVPRLKDTAVQTVPSVLDGAGMIHTPEVSAEQRPSPFSLPLPLPPPPPPHSRRQAVRAGKENVCVSDPAGWGGDPYEPFARTERSRRDRRRPEWNTQRPRRRFVPASERYPAALQKNRQESRLRRQAELLALQDRACLSRTDPAPPPPPLPQLHQEPNLSPNPVQTRSRAAATRKVESVTGGQRVPTAGNTERGRSPPIPALRHRQQRQKLLGSSSPPPPPPAPPPTLELVPYFRTEEIINLEPLELVSTPKPDTHTDAPQRTSSSSPLPPLRSPQRDPLLHNTRTYTQQQQEILRGLAQLRQGLLQEQRELEADNPLLKLRDNRLWSPLTTHRM